MMKYLSTMQICGISIH